MQLIKVTRDKASFDDWTQLLTSWMLCVMLWRPSPELRCMQAVTVLSDLSLLHYCCACSLTCVMQALTPRQGTRSRL